MMADQTTPQPQQSPMPKPSALWNPAANQYEYPMEAIYADRETERTRAYLESVHGTAVDTSQEGLDEAAQGGQQMPKAGETHGRENLASPSEQVRDKAQQALDDPQQKKALNGFLKNWLGLTVEDIHQHVERGTLPQDVSLKLMDPISPQVEKIAEDEAKKYGLNPSWAGGITGLLAGIAFPAPGGKGAKAVRAVEGAATKAGERAIAGVNPSRLEGMAPDVKATIRNIEFFNTARMTRGVVSHAETIAKAKDAMSLAEVLRFDVANKMDLATVQTAIAGHYKQAINYMTDTAKRASVGDQIAARDFWGAYAIAADLAEKDALVGTALGRGLESRKIALADITAGMDPEAFKAFAEKIATGGYDPVQAAQRYLAMTPKQRNTMLTQSMSFYRAGQNALLEAWVNALLSNPVTHAANSASNLALAAWAPAERTLMATVDYGLTLGGTVKPRSVFYGEVPEMLYGAVESYKDVLRIGLGQLREEAKLLRGGVPEQIGRGGTTKIERMPAITAEAFGMDPNTMYGAAVDYIGALARTPSRALVTEDEIFKAANYRMQARSLAYREAAQAGNPARAQEILDNLDKFPSVKTAADNFAAAQTLNRELDELGFVARGLGKGTQAIAHYIPMARVITPFIRTPANALDVTLQFTPGLNLAATNMLRDITKGSPEVRAQAIARFSAGAGASMVLASYAATPINAESPVPYMTRVTGEGPRDKTERDQLRALGWQAYSVWDGTQYVSYKRLEPFGTVLGVVASGTEMLGRLPEAGTSQVATALSIAVGKAMISKTFLEGLSNFLDTMEGKPEDFNKFAQGLARSGVPAGVRQLTRELDPTVREMDTLYDYWRSGLPGYDGPPARNIWGDAVMLSGGLGPDIISPLYASPYKPDDVTEWLLQNRVPVQGAPKAVAGSPPAGVQLTEPTAKMGIKLTPEEHSRFQELMGKAGDAPAQDADLGPLASLPPLKEAVREIINGPGTGGPDGTKADLIRGRVADYKRFALLQLRREYPMLDEHLKALEKQRIDLKTDESLAPDPKAPPGLGDALQKLLGTTGR